VADAAKALIPTPETCAPCHQDRVDQFKKGTHAAAWAAIGAMPTIHWQPMAMAEGMKGCGSCHSAAYAKEQLAKSDDRIRQADHLMAQGIQTVAALYQDGVLPKPKTYAAAFPDPLTFHDAPTVIEQKLFVMFLEHRMRAFQGSFHASDDYAM
jgi:hypothetical protein